MPYPRQHYYKPTLPTPTSSRFSTAVGDRRRNSGTISRGPSSIPPPPVPRLGLVPVPQNARMGLRMVRRRRTPRVHRKPSVPIGSRSLSREILSRFLTISSERLDDRGQVPPHSRSTPARGGSPETEPRLPLRDRLSQRVRLGAGAEGDAGRVWTRGEHAPKEPGRSAEVSQTPQGQREISESSRQRPRSGLASIDTEDSSTNFQTALPDIEESFSLSDSYAVGALFYDLLGAGAGEEGGKMCPSPPLKRPSSTVSPSDVTTYSQKLVAQDPSDRFSALQGAMSCFVLLFGPRASEIFSLSECIRWLVSESLELYLNPVLRDSAPPGTRDGGGNYARRLHYAYLISANPELSITAASV